MDGSFVLYAKNCACYSDCVDTLREALEKINIRGQAFFGEPMAARTSFRIGGPAEAFVLPDDPAAIQRLIEFARERELPVHILGGGTNVLVSDSGLRGLCIGLSRLNRVRPEPGGLYAEAGVPFRALCDAALDASLVGLEFASGLPGSVGGAVFMNARCYDAEMADLIRRVDILYRGEVQGFGFDAKEWAYKKSPFQPGGSRSGAVILGASFALAPGDKESIRRRMEEKKRDRAAKGHYLFPCAGSVFKNDRAFGEPTGKILDRLGFRGLRLRSAAVAEYHANIFINPGRANAADMRALMELAERKAQAELGIKLEREVVLLGDFS
jgi:UDP-N-acetylmuramate dehydrogenase